MTASPYPQAPGARPPLTIEAAATAAAALITDARAAGLLPPSQLTINDYHTHVDLYLSAAGAGEAGVWAALLAWAARYGGQVRVTDHRNPASVYAGFEFISDGIRYAVNSHIPQPPDQDDDEDDEDYGDDAGGTEPAA